MMLWARLLMWAVAIILFIVGGYSDGADFLGWWGWGFALLTAGFLVKALPASMTMGGMRRTDQ
jgi:hypothetical protein